MKLKYVIAGLLMAISANASASLIVNGSFEDNDVKKGSWAKFDASTVNGWDGLNIEIWDHLDRRAAFEGDQLLELNAFGKRNAANNAYQISQTFATDVNAHYSVSFAYQARTSASEAFLFEILNDAGSAIFSELITDHSKNVWRVFDTDFVAPDLFTTISFTSISGGTTGNLIDAVKVTSVPEPATLLPFAVALMFIGARLMRRNSESAFLSNDIKKAS
ncbi:DUF642 domain-containing protein [Aestuariibacter sp. A3R04]|uniref:DUF642 domain-containing protein n=1 Tax=Aestuariibacter sp. A3R04 TaxID=2841571 RepID=UPI001C092ED9|nr:DUF642 domain-containing protein [Aestuariibacter sp. A3R04]MBU3020543.1 DUF642 domain-containing protein [Aestuariibacter sp. A3R04]